LLSSNAVDEFQFYSQTRPLRTISVRVFNRLDHKKIMLAFAIARAYSAPALRSHSEIPKNSATLKRNAHSFASKVRQRKALEEIEEKGIFLESR
jgi:hypothetical protein